jgi:hypothetical protein
MNPAMNLARMARRAPELWIETWSTRTPLAPGFEERWRRRLARTSLAHFGFDPAWLEWNAAHGSHAVAALVDQGERAGALVLREEHGLTCGWPWRSHALMEDRGSPPAPQPSDDEGAWLLEAAGRIASHRRLRCYLPGRPGQAGYRAGITCLNSLIPGEDALLRAVHPDKRRAIRRAAERGYVVVEATTPEQFHAFASLQRETELRRSAAVPPLPESPAAGESWREWELPWMWLLVALKDGRVEAGSGYGVYPGAQLDYRTNASSARGRQEGANVLLGWEGMKQARARGFQWLNWGGATQFKLQHGGTPVEMNCVLAGGWRWAVPNRLSTSLHRARPTLVSIVRSLRGRAGPRSHERASSGGTRNH